MFRNFRFSNGKRFDVKYLKTFPLHLQTLAPIAYTLAPIAFTNMGTHCIHLHPLHLHTLACIAFTYIATAAKLKKNEGLEKSMKIESLKIEMVAFGPKSTYQPWPVPRGHG